VQPGDTLSAIAARFGIQGGWPPLYASNLKAIGWNPDVLHPGTVLVLPGLARARYTITTGDTLSGIAAGLRIPGGWPALYAANRQVIGSNPGSLQPGTVLRLPRPAAAHPSGVTPPSRHPAPPPPPAPAPGAGPGTHHRHPVTSAAVSAAAGMPSWLKTMLVALGLLILVALLTEPVLAAVRRRQRQKAALQPAGLTTAATAGPPGPAGQLRPAPATPDRTSIVLADHDRLVVTCNKTDETVYVLRPPGEDPRAILRVARLVLPESRYWELASQLGVPAAEPAD
jgi:LysM repeat protein